MNEVRFNLTENTERISKLLRLGKAADQTIFVFTSNMEGDHAKGASLEALTNWGAVLGSPVGRQGLSYAIPAKSHRKRLMPITGIWPYTVDFIRYAELHPELLFKVSRIGCSPSGYRDSEMAPMFRNAPSNCYFDTNWHPTLGDSYNYWGHHA